MIELTNPTLQMAMLRQYVDNHNLPEASEAAECLLALDSDNIEAMVEKITLWFTWGTPELVSEEGYRIHELVPGSAEDLFAQVTTNPGGPPPDALALLNQAVKLDASFERAWYARGMLLFKEGQFSKAIQSFERALYLAPRHSMAMLYIGKTRYHLRDYSGAIPYLIEYSKTPNFCDKLQVFGMLADCYLQMALTERQIMDKRYVEFQPEINAQAD